MIDTDALRFPYQVPPKEIQSLVDQPLPPAIRIDSKARYLVLLERQNFKTIEELMAPELRLAGLKINPQINLSNRVQYYTGIQIKDIQNDEIKSISGLPKHPKIVFVKWSPDEQYLSFVQISNAGLSLWLINIQTLEAKPYSKGWLNANLTSPYLWSPCSQYLITLEIPSNRAALVNKKEIPPTGPVIHTTNGQTTQHRTYQDLLKDTYDAYNFDILSQSELKKYTIDGEVTDFMRQNLYTGLSFSPDGQFLSIETLLKPFSYSVPVSKFAQRIDLYDRNGRFIQNIDEIPAQEQMPKGFMAVHTYKRSIQWKNNAAATLIYVKALDQGDPSIACDYRDEIFLWDVRSAQAPHSLFKTEKRFSHILWGKNELALISDYWWDSRYTGTYAIKIKENHCVFQKKIISRDFQDQYNHPGHLVTEKNQYHRSVLSGTDEVVYLEGDGFSEEGHRPFIDQWKWSSDHKTRLWQVDNTSDLTQIAAIINIDQGQLVLRKESNTTFPNYYLAQIDGRQVSKAITRFNNPFKALTEVHTEILEYKREDGVHLHGRIFLPPDYETAPANSIPLILWAYPNEFKNKQFAGQVTSSKNQFIYPWYGSPIYWVLRGYAVMEDASFPIIGQKEEEPNDTFIEQLIANAEAAIQAVQKYKSIDPDRVVVGGHSYGAFMAANLVTWSSLFVAAIARSGAYNRSLTPFGFQSEQRTFWEAKETYLKMSPFNYVPQIKAPILLIHGQEDNNSGTFLMQSERYYEALKSVGAKARLVILPKESHGYQARESILHMLWEQDEWIKQHCEGTNPQ